MSDQLPDKLEMDLRNLPKEALPPPGLEERIVKELRIMNQRQTNRWARILTAAVVAGAMFGLGFFFGRGRSANAVPSPAAPSSHFALLLREGPGTLQGASLVAEYRDWAISEAKQGRLVSGEKLSDEGRLLRAGSSSAADFVRPGELGGFFIIAAENFDAASRIAATCPHLKHGGTIELRAIEVTQ